MRNTKIPCVKKLLWSTSILTLLCILTLLFHACSGSSGGDGGVISSEGEDLTAEESSTNAKWTIIAYMDGNNDHDYTALGTSFYIRKVQDMEQIGSTDEVNIVSMVSSMKLGGVAQYYYVEKYTDEMPDQISSTVLEDLGTVDMSDPATLENFISYVLDKEEYQADHYMLVLADHGLGWMGLCLDEIQGETAIITMNELNEALTAIDFKFDIIAFDACLMGMVEVADEIADFADYMVASQNVTWVTIDLGYTEWLEALVNDPDMDPGTVSDNVARAIYNAGVSNNIPVTTSVIDLSKMQRVCSAVGTFANDLVVFAGQYGNNIKAARDNCHEEQSVPYFIDLKQFAGNIKNDSVLSTIPKIEEEADELMEAVTEACRFNKGNVGYPRNGLSIYFPRLNDHYSDALANEYRSIKFSETNWYNFINAYIQTFGDEGEEGDGYVDSSLSGTVSWPGHELPPNTIAFLDSSTTTSITVEAALYVDPATGAYTFNLELNAPMAVTVWAFNDADDNRIWDNDENIFGWYDMNGDGYWSVDDMITINPGDSITGVNFILYTWE